MQLNHHELVYKYPTHLDSSVKSSKRRYNFIAEKTGCAEPYHMFLGWFYYTELSLPTSGTRCVGHFYASLGWFNRIKPP